MDFNNGSAPTYLAYFTKYVNPPRAEETPFWTQQRLDDLENWQPQIVTRDYYNQDCYSERLETYQCHICNINVPKMCYQIHNESNQHETIKKIYEKVLERVSKQMYVNSVNTDKDIDQSFYYCELCSTIVKKENKNDHEATEYHANSIKRSISINDFYNIIMTENFRFDVKKEELGEEVITFNPNNNYNETQDMSIDACSSIDCEEFNDDLWDQKIILPPVQVQNIIETENKSTEEEKEQSFVEYGKEMIKKYNLKVTLPAVDGDFIKIVAPNGDRVKVFRDNFHSYQKSTSTYCQLCSEWIPQNTRLHDVTEKHVRNIFKPINENFARGIDNDWSHCIPCNKLVSTFSDDHSHGYDHKTVIKDTLIAKTDKTLCKDCNIYIDSHNFAVHVKSIKHLVMKHNSIKETGYNNIFCNICKITLPKSVLNMHISTELHLKEKAKNMPVVNVQNKNTELPVTKKAMIVPVVNVQNKNTELPVTKKAMIVPVVNVQNKNTELPVTKKAMIVPVVNVQNKNTELPVTKKAMIVPVVNVQNKNTELPVTKKAMIVPVVNVQNKNTELPVTKKAMIVPVVNVQNKNTELPVTKKAMIVPVVNVQNKNTELPVTKKAMIVPVVNVQNKNTELPVTKKAMIVPVVNVQNKNTELPVTKKAMIVPVVNVQNKNTELPVTKKAMIVPVVNVQNKNTELPVTKKAKNMFGVSGEIKNTEVRLKKKAKKRPVVNGENKNTELRFTKKAKNIPGVNDENENTEQLLTKKAKKRPVVNDENKNTEGHLTKKAKNMPEYNKNKGNTIVNKKNIDAYNGMTIEFVDETRTKVRCKVCSVHISNSERNIVGHMKGKNHTRTIQKLEAYNKLMFYTDIAKTQLVCQICDLNVPDCDREIIKHMEGRNHIFAENGVLRFHSMTRELTYFVCGCCGIRTTDYIEHINSTSHTLEFAKKYPIDEFQMRKFVNENTVNNFVAQLHRQLYSNLLKHNGIFRLDDSIFCCCLCQINLNRANEINHVLGLGHIKAMDRLRADLRYLQ